VAVNLATAYVQIMPSMQGFRKEVDAGLKGLDKPMESAGKRSGGMFSGALGKTLKVAGIASAGATAAGTFVSGFQKGLDRESSGAVFEGFFGKGGAKKFQAEIDKIAKNTTIDTSAYRKGGENLAYLGLNAEESANMLDRIAIAASGTGKGAQGIDTASAALSNMVSEGRVTNETLKQLSGSGVPVFESLAAHFGVGIDQVRDLVREGGVEIEDVYDVIQNADTESWQAIIKANDARNKTFSGQWNRLKDTAVETLGKMLLPVMKALTPLLDAIGTGIEWIGDLFSGAGENLGAFGEVVTGVFGSIRDFVVETIIPAFVQFWDETLKPIFEDWWAVVTDLWENALQPIFEKLVQVIQDRIIPVVVSLWENAVKPAFEKISSLIKTVWDGVLHPLLKLWANVIKNVLAPVITWLWENVTAPAFEGIGKSVEVAWGILSPIFSGIETAIDVIGTVVSWLWNEIMVPAWDGIGNAISGAWGFIQPIIDAFGSAIEGVGNVAGSVADGIKTAFSGLKRIITLPLNALGKALQIVPRSIFGMEIPGASSVRDWGDTLAALRTGGRVPAGVRDGLLYGPGTGTSDSILGIGADGLPTAMVSAGEFVVNARMTKRWLPLLMAVNSGKLPAYASGGFVREPYGLPVGTNTGGFGSSGDIFPQWVKDVEDEFNIRASTYPGHQERDGLNKGIDWVGSEADMQRFAEYLVGIADQLEQVIWMNPSTGQKIGVADGQLVGPGTDQPGYYRNDWAGHADHVHTRQSFSFPAKEPVIDDVPATVEVGDESSLDGDFSTSSSVDDGPQLSEEAQQQKDLADSISANFGNAASAAVSGQITDALGVFGIGDSPPLLAAYNQYVKDRAEWEAAQAERSDDAEDMADEVVESASELAEAVEEDTGPPVINYSPAGGAEQWRPLLEWAADYVGSGFTTAQAQMDAGIKQINTESGGDPNAVQQVRDVNWPHNKAVGLLQIAKGTWPGVRDPDFPDDRTDPVANIVGALNYYLREYGTDLTTNWGRGMGYASGGWVSGPGTGTSDDVAAWLSDGEFVVRADAARKHGALLEAINEDRMAELVPTQGGGRQGGVEIHNHNNQQFMDQREVLADVARQTTKALVRAGMAAL